MNIEKLKNDFNLAGIEVINNAKFNQLKIEDEILSLIPKEVVRKFNIFPFEKEVKDNELIVSVFINDPEIITKEKEILIEMSDYRENANVDKLVFYGILNKEDLDNLIVGHYKIEINSQNSFDGDVDITTETDEENVEEDVKKNFEEEIQSAPIVSKVNSIIWEAIRRKVSDIHFETTEKNMIVRFRIDGILKEQKEFNITIAERDNIIRRLLYLAKLRIDIKQEPQDGSFRLIKDKDKKNKKETDIRISFLPSLHGGKIVLRILDRGNTTFKLDQLGFSKETIHLIKRNINKPNGVILLTGPTGSGKTTTLYSFLSMLDNIETKNVQTL